MREFEKIYTGRINDYYYTTPHLPYGTGSKDCPLVLDALTQLDAERMAAWCCFDRAPETWGEIHVVHRFFVAFRILIGASTPGRGRRAREAAREALFSRTDWSCPRLRPALVMREAEQYDELRRWLSDKKVMSAWAKKYSSVFTF